MVRMMQDGIKHDPVMWERYVEATNAQLELEIKLVKESKKDVREIRPESSSK